MCTRIKVSKSVNVHKNQGLQIGKHAQNVYQPLSHIFCRKSKLIVIPESRKDRKLSLTYLSHVFCRKSKAVLNPAKYSIMGFQGVWKVTLMIINENARS
jgi:hypothetical protein